MKNMGELMEIAEKHKDVIAVIFQIPYVYGVSVDCLSETGEEIMCLRVKVEKEPDLIRKILAKEIDGLKIEVVEGEMPKLL